MNPNIRVINENLWVVNFAYVKAGYIKELNFTQTASDDFIAITDDGKIILDKANEAAIKHLLPLFRVVMDFPYSFLGTDKGFMICMKAAVPSLEKYNYSDMVQKLQKANVYTANSKGFDAICKLEIERRKLYKQYRKENKIPLMIKKYKERR